MAKERPLYANIVRFWKDRASLSVAAIAERTSLSEAYINKIIQGKLSPMRGSIRLLKDALSASTAEEDEMIDAVSADYHAQELEEAAREDRRARFLLIRAYGTSRWQGEIKAEFERAIAQCNAQDAKYPVTGQEKINGLTLALMKDYRAVLERRDIKTTEELVRQLIDVSGLHNHEVDIAAGWKQTYVTKILHPKERGFSHRSIAWGELADALMLGKLRLKQHFLARITQLKLTPDEDSPAQSPRSLAQVCNDLKLPAEDTAQSPTHISRIVKALCEDRVGNSQKFFSMTQLEKAAGIRKYGLIRKNERCGAIYEQETLQNIAMVIELSSPDTKQLLKIGKEQQVAKRREIIRSTGFGYARGAH